MVNSWLDNHHRHIVTHTVYTLVQVKKKLKHNLNNHAHWKYFFSIAQNWIKSSWEIRLFYLNGKSSLIISRMDQYRSALRKLFRALMRRFWQMILRLHFQHKNKRKTPAEPLASWAITKIIQKTLKLVEGRAFLKFPCWLNLNL